MYQIGDRIYHRGQNANGTVVGFRGLRNDRPNEYKDYIGVKFAWATMSPDYYSTIKPRRDAGEEVEWWTRDEELVPTPKPETTKRMTMFGTVGFKKRLRAICELDRQYHNRFNVDDILLGYGKLKASTQASIPAAMTMLNRNINCDKFRQCQQLEDLAPEVAYLDGRPSDPENWIVKPFYSVGGFGVEPYLEQQPYHKARYMQRKVNKVREFRAHTFNWASEKTPLIQEKKIGNPDQLCWNKQQGGSFHYVYQPHLGRDELDPTLCKRIQQMSEAAIKRVGYDWGGVDLGLDDENRLWIFEVNSMVGAREMTQATWKQVMWEAMI